MEIGSQLHAIRERAGLSLRALARELGLSHQAIMYIERGDNLPSVETMLAWCRACGTSIRFVPASGLATDDEALLERLAAVLPYIPGERRDVLIAQLKIWEDSASRRSSSGSR